MERLRQAAEISVGRACGFAAFAIVCIMLALSFDPALMMRGGAILTLLLALALWAKAWIARRQRYRDTETWLILPREHRPPPEIAQIALIPVLRETYLRFARIAASVSVAFWLIALLLGALL